MSVGRMEPKSWTPNLAIRYQKAEPSEALQMKLGYHTIIPSLFATTLNSKSLLSVSWVGKL